MQPVDNERIFRNHPSVIASYMVSMAIVLVVLIMLSLREYAWDNKTETLLIVAVLMAAVAGWGYFYWKRTIYIFEDNELHVTRDAIYKMDKHIQYTRLASVSVRRDLINRIFGTSTLIFNVNSSMNAQSAEATLVLKTHIADRLRSELNAMIFEKEVKIDEERFTYQTLVRVSNSDVVLHAILGQPTWQALFGLLMLFYAVVTLFADSSGGFITAVVLFAVSEIIPFISVILKYYNYRIIRVGDTITVECGLITTRRQSFKVNKINSVRIREPLLARLFGRSMLEAEVIGMADEDNNNAPVLCPLKKRADVRRLLDQLLPELVFESKPERQPRRALIPMLITDTLFTLVIVGVCLGLFFTAETYLCGCERHLDADRQGNGGPRRSGRASSHLRTFRNGPEAPHIRHGRQLVHVRVRGIRHLHGVHQLRQGPVYRCNIGTVAEAVRRGEVHREHDVLYRIQADHLWALRTAGSREGGRRGQRQDSRWQV